eukprot:TRINITY_DN34524_c0_g1_i1.p2 TRINITY_DN34524_c0_g1~~TRINITY_DN34524_c0_g1_i1.p2  ORF type:complete len:75 (+),score=2.79 TRINITY_DN34524_c0_g1_i1:66-290(+)
MTRVDLPIDPLIFSASAAAAADCSGDISTLSFLLSDLVSTDTAHMFAIALLESKKLSMSPSSNPITSSFSVVNA